MTHRDPRRRMLAVAALVVLWAIWRVGVTEGRIVNLDGLDSFWSFWRAVASPELGGDFLRLTIDAAAVTIAFAVLGTVVALAIGAVGALTLAETLWPSRGGRLLRTVATALFAVPRAVHEIVWAILLLLVFGFDPWVAIIAIGLPFGAVTAKVFAETIDEADQRPFRLLRSLGASRAAALAYGTLPQIRGELLSYAFYRLECAVRSAAIVGVIGVGGLGFQLDLSFESLRYGEIWTIIAALMVISGLADRWSTLVRRSRGEQAVSVRRWSLLAGFGLVVFSWWRVDLDPSTLWSERTRRLAGDTLADLWPPSLGPGGWSELFEASIDTAAMSVVALVIASIGGVALGAAAARPTGAFDDHTVTGRIGRFALRWLLLLFRAVPPPVWAFVAVLVLFAGAVPGAVALGVYNVGVVGRLVAEALEERPTDASDLAISAGASRPAAFLTVRLPDAAGRIVALLMYRWEVIVRETVVVGVVGAGGLGQLLNEHRAARDFDAVTGTIVAMLLLAVIVDQVSRVVRRRIPSAS